MLIIQNIINFFFTKHTWTLFSFKRYYGEKWVWNLSSLVCFLSNSYTKSPNFWPKATANKTSNFRRYSYPYPLPHPRWSIFFVKQFQACLLKTLVIIELFPQKHFWVTFLFSVMYFFQIQKFILTTCLPKLSNINIYLSDLYIFNFARISQFVCKIDQFTCEE